MQLEIEPFRDEHLQAASELLAARHQRDRQRAPELPARFEQPAEALTELRAARAAWGTSGAVALRSGSMVGYLLGSITLPEPLTTLGWYIPPRSAVVLYAGHAVAAEDAEETHRELYAALAPRWLAAGCFSHLVHLPAGARPALAAWWSLGFGQESFFGVRQTGGRPDAGAARLEIRRAQGGADFETVLRLVWENDRHHAASPLFRPFFPEALEKRRQEYEAILAREGSVAWLGFRDGRPAGLLLLVRPAPGMDAPEDCIHLIDAFTLPEARGEGVGGRLLEHAMAWARQAGYDRCLVDWVAQNLLGDRFWRRSFRPLTCWLRREVDPRIAWGGVVTERDGFAYAP